MSELHFIVVQRDGVWQYTSRGNTFSHFASREEAIEAAIEAARDQGDPDARVIVQDSEMRQETVWQGQD